MRATFALLLLVLALPAAAAHATLQSAQPAPNGQAEAGLAVLVVRFTEDVEAQFTSADVVDPAGESWAAGPVELDPSARNVVRLPLRPLENGVYSASWRALSADSHTTRGTFLFAVGDATLEDAAPPFAQDPMREGVAREGFARAAFYAGLLLALGLPAFALLVARDPERPLLLAAAAAGALGALAALAILLLLADRAELSLRAAAATAPGAALASRGGLLLAAALAAILAARLPARRRALAAVSIALAAAALVATSYASHAAAREERGLLVLADALHLATAAAWVGGTVGFLHVARRRTSEELGAWVARFSTIALASAVLLLATGSYLALRRVPCLQEYEGGFPCATALREEPYVRLVAAKLLLVAPLVAMAAYNRLRLAPRLSAGRGGLRALRRVAQAEAVVMVLLVVAAGVLAATSPPDQPVEAATPRAPTSLVLQNLSAKTHLVVELSPAPVRVGVQELVVQAHPLGAPLPDATQVAIKTRGPGEPETSRVLERTAPGEWTLREALFTAPGTWRLTVVVDRPDESYAATFEIPVEAA